MVGLVDRTIDLGALIAEVRTDACGAVVTFLGVVRETSPDDPRRVIEIAYEAYAKTALPEMEAIAGEAVARFGPQLEIAIVHRIGTLELGAVSVAIAVAAPHRAHAFDACEYAIDEVKRRVTVWKQEVYADGARGWVDNTPSGRA